MTKFDGVGRGRDRRGVEATPDVLVTDVTPNVPCDGFIARGCHLRDEREDEKALEADDETVVRRAIQSCASTSSSIAVFFDAHVENDDATLGGATRATVVVAFARHERDGTTNAARALEWFAHAREWESDIDGGGKSYDGCVVRVIEDGKVLSIDAPMAFERSTKTKLTTRVGAASPRDAWLDDGAVRVFLGARSTGTTYIVPERAIYLGQASERSFAALVGEISRSMDRFVGSSAELARVRLCGEIIDDFGCTEEGLLLETNRKRVVDARAKMRQRNESVESTRKRLERESATMSERVRDAVLRGSSRKRQSTVERPAWDTLGDIADDDESSDEDTA